MTDPLKEITVFLNGLTLECFSFLLWPLGIGILIISGLYFYNRGKVQRLARALGARTSLGNHGQGAWEGLPYEFSYKPGGEHESAHLELRTAHDFPGEFCVSKETGVDRFLQKFRICQELKTGDEAFDRNYYVETNNEETAARFFSQESKRRVVDFLFASGVTRIEHTGKQLMMDQYPFPKEAAAVLEVLKRAKELLENAAYSGGGGATVFWGTRKLKGMAGFIGALLFLAGIISFAVSQGYHVFDTRGVILFSLKYSLPPLFFFWACLIFFFKGKSFFGRLFFSVFFSSLIGGLLLGFSAVKILNAQFDRNPAQYRQAMVLERRRGGENGEIPQLCLRGWRASRQAEVIKVSEQHYGKAIPGKTIALLTIRSGRFGFEWLVREQLLYEGK